MKRLTETTSAWLARMGERLRSSWSGPLTSSGPELARLWAAPPTSTGVAVTEQSALNFSAVWSAVTLISGDVASLPLCLFKRLPGGGKERFTAHPLYRLLHDAPNPELSSGTWRRTATAHMLLWGNSYSEIERDNGGRPIALWPITPDRVRPFRAPDGRLRYGVTNQSQTDSLFEATDILHAHGLSFDGVEAYSVVAKARESIGLGLAAETFGGTFFGNGSTFGGVLEHPGKLSDPARQNIRESLEARHKGVDRAHKFLIIEENMKYQRLGIPPEDAQFLETRQFQVTEIARWFNVPPHKLGDLERATFSNIEQQTIDYYQTTLVHWLRTWEEEINLKLIAPSERNIQFAEHVVEGLLRGDAAGRAQFYTALFQIGAITPNEIRSLENLNPMPGGDSAYVPMNMTPLDRTNDAD